MSKKMELGCVKATSIAAVNAVVNHLGLGLYMSQIDLMDYINDYESPNPFIKHDLVTLDGWTNTGKRVCAKISFKGVNEKETPLKHVVVWVSDGSGGGSEYLCLLESTDKIEVRQHYSTVFPFEFPY